MASEALPPSSLDLPWLPFSHSKVRRMTGSPSSQVIPILLMNYHCTGAAHSLSSDGPLSTLERRVIKFYHLVSSLAFLLSLNTIILATVAHTSVLHGRFDPMAETAYMMMKREFEYEVGGQIKNFIFITTNTTLLIIFPSMHTSIS